MALLVRPIFAQQSSSLCRRFSMATMLAGRKKNEKLDVPKDKEGIIIGKRKPAVYYPKEGVSDKTHPIHVNWQRPVTIQTCNPEISGDSDVFRIIDGFDKNPIQVMREALRAWV